MNLTTYGQTLMDVSSFKYMGRVLSGAYDDWPSVVANLRKAQKRWAHLLRVLGHKGTDACMLGNFYMKLVQAFPLFV